MSKYLNESGLDRVIRAVLSIALFLIAYFYLEGTAATVTIILAAVLLFTAITGFCLLYKIFSISTKK